MQAAKEQVVRQVLEENIPQFSKLDATVAEYIVAVLIALEKERIQAQQLHTATDPKWEDASNLASLLVSHGLYEEKEEALKVWQKIFPILQLGDVANVDTQPHDIRTLDKPILMKPEDEEKKEAKKEDREVLTYLSCDLKEKLTENPVEDFLANTASPDPKIRKLYLRELCPCHVQRDIEVVWDRIIQMTDDADPDVRYQVLHNLCDGSPAARESDIIAALEKMHNDPDQKIRRRVHQVLSHYRKTGKWNIL